MELKRSLIGVLVLALCACCAPASIAAPNPQRTIAAAQHEWAKEMRESATSGDRAAKFPSPSRAILIQRLHRAAVLYGFRVVSVRMLHPLQSAPVVVISSNDKPGIARATAKIVDIFDPRRVTYLDPSGYAYEGYFLVAETSSGVPYLSTFNHWRAPHVGGGEWAASEDLYPFPHG